VSWISKLKSIKYRRRRFDSHNSSGVQSPVMSQNFTFAVEPIMSPKTTSDLFPELLYQVFLIKEIGIKNVRNQRTTGSKTWNCSRTRCFSSRFARNSGVMESTTGNRFGTVRMQRSIRTNNVRWFRIMLNITMVTGFQQKRWWKISSTNSQLPTTMPTRSKYVYQIW